MTTPPTEIMNNAKGLLNCDMSPIRKAPTTTSFPPSPSAATGCNNDDADGYRQLSPELSSQLADVVASLQSSFGPPVFHQSHIKSRPYKGFSTPFCGLFQTSGGLPTKDLDVEAARNKSQMQIEHEHYQHDNQISHLRTDICSLACFGVCQSDQTRYLFTNTHPPLFFKRMTYHVLIPAFIFLLAGWCSGNIRNQTANSVICALLIYSIFVWYVLACFRGRKHRIMVREEILWKLKRREEKFKRRQEEQRQYAQGVLLGGGGENHAPGEFDVPYVVASVDTNVDYEYYSDDDEQYHRSNYDSTLGQTRFEMNCAHRMIGCYPSDISPASQSNVNNDDSGYILQQPADPFNSNGDLCTRIWNCFSSPCLARVTCFGSEGCYFQLCGFCALAQEAREANMMLPRYLRMVDYITMEPFLLYYPKILELRWKRSGSFLDHCNALSTLSMIILQTLAVILAAMLAMSLFNAFGHWNLTDMGMLGATFLQAFAVMYAIHWGWHKYDLSIDAVIKYFACGFLLCTSMAFGVELTEYLTFRLIVMVVISILGVEEEQETGYGGLKLQSIGYQNFQNRYLHFTRQVENDSQTRFLVSDSDILNVFFDSQPAVRIIYILLTAYLMTGLVEEFCKYFGYVMIDHPDFCSEFELAKSKAMISTQLRRSRSVESDVESPNTNQVPGEVSSFEPSMQKRPLSSIRGGVTVAMVAVAIGFTCCENIVYIFVYNRSSLQSEITTLITKSLFPVHAIAAAIQSIYICRRDLERDSSIGLGRVVLPSLLFHGTYDFALLLISDTWKRSQASQYFYSGNVSNETIITLCISFTIVLIGVLFYVVQSRRQYDRLDQLSHRIREVQMC